MEIIIGLATLLLLSIVGLIIQSKKINKIKLAGIKSETILKEANRQADRIIKDAKFQSDKDFFFFLDKDFN